MSVLLFMQVVFIGMMVGSSFWGWIADSLGRFTVSPEETTCILSIMRGKHTILIYYSTCTSGTTCRNTEMAFLKLLTVHVSLRWLLVVLSGLYSQHKTSGGFGGREFAHI